VWLFSQGERQYTTSDEQGRYAFKRLAAGTYHLIVETEAGQQLRIGNEPAHTVTLEPGAQYQTTLEVLRPGESVSVPSVRTPRQATGRIEGTVTAEDTSSPLEVGVRVLDTNGELVASIMSISTGFYAFSDLPPGSYYVEFNPGFGFGTASAYRVEYYNDAATLAEADLVTVTASETTVVDAQLDRGGQISGTVTAVDTGLPLEGVRVYVDNYCGSTAFVTYDSGRTDSDGNYTVSGLSPGSYTLEFSTRYASQEQTQSYLGEYYEDRSVWTAADQFEITGTVEITGINAQLERGGQISGVVTAEDTSNPLEDVRVHFESQDGSFSPRSVETDSSGSYTSNGLPIGQYTVMFSTANTSDDVSEEYLSEYYNNQATADVADLVNITAPNMMSGIDAALAPGGKISGIVTAADTITPLDDVIIDVFDTAGNFYTDAYADSSGAYEAVGLPSGDYIVEFITSNRLSSDAKEYPDQYYNQQPFFADGEAVTVTAPGTTTINAALAPGGQISGTVTASDTGEPLEDVIVYTYMSDVENSYTMAQTQTDSNGEYTLYSVFDGNYYVSFNTTSSRLSTSARNYAPEVYDGVHWGGSSEERTVVSVTTGNVTSGIDADLDHGAPISGIVTSPEGDPLSDIMACIYYYPDESSSPICRFTNDLGYYELRWLSEGERRVQFVPLDSRCYTYLPEFYDDKPSFDTADIITTVSPNPTNNIDAVLSSGINTYIPIVAR
jgi:5-hydroxyisourate hydrolase-like protein (transthyretin family)